MSPFAVNFASFMFGTLNQILSLYSLIVIASVVMTWVDASPYNPIVRAIYGLTEPVLDWVRRRVPVFFGGFDFSPLVVIFGIQFLQQVVIRSLAGRFVYGSY
jgi:YggT family protein